MNKQLILIEEKISLRPRDVQVNTQTMLTENIRQWHDVQAGYDDKKTQPFSDKS